MEVDFRSGLITAGHTPALAVGQSVSVKVFIVVSNVCRASNDFQLLHCVGIKLKLGHFHGPINCPQWVALLNLLQFF